MGSGDACESRHWGLRWSSYTAPRNRVRGVPACGWCGGQRQGWADEGGSAREGMKEGDAWRCLSKTRTQHHRMIGAV
eukprot:815397-Pyramimonas_sp.AAC.1